MNGIPPLWDGGPFGEESLDYLRRNWASTTQPQYQVYSSVHSWLIGDPSASGEVEPLNDPGATASLDQFEGLTTSIARQVGAYYRELIQAGIPTDAASELAEQVQDQLLRVLIPRPARRPT